ncbi:MAG TPA: VWA domain-containing protein [Thermodesulfobacteriaceae bacterium]|nr:VWA domain-containing protein [Thermodesulfobacteriaceae bacterium]
MMEDDLQRQASQDKAVSTAGIAADSRHEEALKNALLEIFFTESIGDCHVDTAVEILLRLPGKYIAPVLSQVRLISGTVSDMLAFSFIENAAVALDLLTVEQMGEWVRGAISIYEAKGLHPACEYFSNASLTSAKYAGDNKATSLEDVAADMRLLAAGITGRHISFKTGRQIYTDTASIYAPGIISTMPDSDTNSLLYKMLIVHKCAQIRYRSFYMSVDRLAEALPSSVFSLTAGKNHSSLTGFELFCRAVFGDAVSPALFALVDTPRIEALLRKDYPGLAAQLSRLKNILYNILHKIPEVSENPVITLAKWILSDYEADLPSSLCPDLSRHLYRLRTPASTSIDSALACTVFAPAYTGRETLAMTDRLLPYIGTVVPREVGKVMLERRREVENRFIEILSVLLMDPGGQDGKTTDEIREEKIPCPMDGNEAATVIFPPSYVRKQACDDEQECGTVMFLNGKEIEMPDEFSEILSEIQLDLGGIPSSYVSSAVKLATGLWCDADQGDTRQETPVLGTFVYDEWDFRRNGYRYDWCTVKEMDSPEIRGSFISHTLTEYHGQVHTIRRQFEMLRNEHHFLKRQKEGDEIDIDALVEAHSDFKATGNPSEQLFIRQKKDKRNIAVSFLVDMSASTEGWVNRAIKESLVLLCEALNVLGDRFSIYGFTGMRRTGCQFFRIKDFHEHYNEDIQARITGISARDYTRMGPAVRHATSLFLDMEARLRIMIVLSDGKPEDYDEYKGQYAVEDTRKAIIESRIKGVKPFCITIDRQAKDYLPHMFGESGYILVSDVAVLHRRLPEIYRLLTT